MPIRLPLPLSLNLDVNRHTQINSRRFNNQTQVAGKQLQIDPRQWWHRLCSHQWSIKSVSIVCRAGLAVRSKLWISPCVCSINERFALDWVQIYIHRFEIIAAGYNLGWRPISAHLTSYGFINTSAVFEAFVASLSTFLSRFARANLSSSDSKRVIMNRSLLSSLI